jgi:hypothetical protein
VRKRGRGTAISWTANTSTRCEHAKHLIGDGIHGVAVQALLAEEMWLDGARAFQSVIHVKSIETNHALSSTGPHLLFLLMQQSKKSRWFEKIMTEKLSCCRSVFHASGEDRAEEYLELRVC